MRVPSLIWKRGVTRYSQDALTKVAREKRREGSWQFSYRLLAELQSSFTDQDESLLERLYSSMAAGEGIYKITKRNRFQELDQRILEEAASRQSHRRLAIHDGACSSGVTSLELWQKLKNAGDWTLTASDYFTRLWLVDIAGWTVAIDQFGKPIQITGCGVVMSPAGPISPFLPINRILRTYATRNIVPQAISIWKKSQAGTAAESSIREVPLFHPHVIQEEALHAGFETCTHNLFEPLRSKVDIFRVMNFLTPNHLTSDQISTALRAVRSSLSPGGLLIIGRTRDESDGALLASAYRNLGDAQLEKVWEMDGPWECESLVAAPVAA